MRRPAASIGGALRRLRRAAAAEPFFDARWYRERYPGAPRSDLAARLHYLVRGRARGLDPTPPEAALFLADLWSGAPEGARERVEARLRDGRPAERAQAAWALARWHAAQADWAATWEAIGRLRAQRGWRHLVPGPGPDLMTVAALARLGRAGEAGVALRALRPGGDRAIAAADVARGEGAGPPAMVEALGRALVRGGVEPLVMVEGDAPPFDRLEAAVARSARRLPSDAPLVTAIVPARDAASTLATALRGLRAQSWPRLEILVVENGSRDGTLAVAEAEAARDPRVRVLRSREPGAYPARNLGLAEAAGDYVTVHDADDWSHPRRIEAQMAPLLGRRPPLATISHWARLTPELELWTGRLEEGIVHRNVSSLLFPTRLRETLGYWDRVRAGADTEFQDRLVARFGPAALLEVARGTPLALGRVLPGSLTQRSETRLSTRAWGPRRAYEEAAHRWHAGTEPNGLHLARAPERRPFPAPPALALESSPAEGSARPRRPPGADVARVRRRAWAAAALGRPPRPAPIAPMPGRLAFGPERPRVLVCGHQAEDEVFGAERSLLDTLDHLAAAGHAPVAALPSARNAAYVDAVLSRVAALHIVPYAWWREGREAHPVTVSALRRAIRSEGAREVHVNTLTIDAPLIAARAEGVPGIMHVRELPAGDPALCGALGAPPDAIRARILAAADRFVANSPLVAEWLDAPGRVSVRGNTVDASLFDLPPPCPDGPVRIGLVGSLVAKKGLGDAVALARRLGRRVELRLVGAGTRDLLALRPLPGNVRHPGYAPSPREAMESLDVVLSLSLFAESFGRTVLEGMAAARPVVAYGGGMPERLVAHGRTGFVVPRGDVEAAATALGRLVEEPGLIGRMGEEGRARARTLLPAPPAPAAAAPARGRGAAA